MVIRAPFLLLALILAFLGASVAWYEGSFNFGYALLAGLGLVLTHASVNVFNEYFDFKSGVDFKTKRTPFSGGSGALPQGLLSGKQALRLGIGTLAAAGLIGIYFILALDKGLQLLPLLIVAGVIIVLYTPVILKTNWPEWAPGLGLGILPVIGAYFVQTEAYATSALIASIPSGILVHNLLLLNEFPDVEADLSVHKKTLPITIGKKKAGVFYSAMTVLVYLWTAGAVAAGKMPVFCLIALLTIPLAVKAIQGALKPDDMSKLGPALASNVMVILLTQLLLGAGFILAKAFS
jgi:1,4-dihydroxy-2-naphthoate polyprenyltransferase